MKFFKKTFLIISKLMIFMFVITGCSSEDKLAFSKISNENDLVVYKRALSFLPAKDNDKALLYVTKSFSFDIFEKANLSSDEQLVITKIKIISLEIIKNVFLKNFIYIAIQIIRVIYYFYYFKNILYIKKKLYLNSCYINIFVRLHPSIFFIKITIKTVIFISIFNFIVSFFL